MTGTGYSTVKTILKMAGQETECRSTFFRHQAVSEEKLVDSAEQLAEKARSHFSGNVSVDCRWSSPVWGIHGVVSDVDTETLEVLEFAILTKKTVGTFIVIDQMKRYRIFEKINKLIKDRDNKSKKLIEETGAGDKIANDPGHFKKNFEKA